MIRDILINRWFLGGCGFLILLSIGCYFWYQHELAPYKQEAAEAQKQWEASQKTTETDPSIKQVGASRTTSMKTTSVNGTANAIGTVSENIDNSKPKNSASVDKTDADVPVSPYGFGPYPEIPEGFGPVTWSRRSRDSELMKRVRIKLFSQGVDVRGTTMEYGKIYPTIKGIIYVRWNTDDIGEKYICELLCTPEDGDRLDAISEAKFNRGEDDFLTEADIPADIKIVLYEEGGIDPFTFLDLPKF